MRNDVDLDHFALGVSDYLADSKRLIDSLDTGQIATVLSRLLAAYRRSGVVYVFGNGGSAATASHFVTDFNRGVGAGSDIGFRVHSLNDNVPTMLAVANDVAFEQVFALQLRTFLRAGDLVLAISASGRSRNVLEAVRYAKSRGVETIGLVGYCGGPLRELADYCIHVPSDDMQKVEDIHLAVSHLMMTQLRRHLVPDATA